MDYYKILQKLRDIDLGNMFITYIIDRVLDDDYRGFQCSQHNRLTYDYFANVIRAIYDIAQDKKFDIHVGDDQGNLQARAYKYYQVVDEIKKLSGKGTINSVKKNTFPDIARMGFILRYDSKDKLIDEIDDARSRVYSVQLSDSGVQFVKSNQFARIKMFTDGIDKLTKNTASELVELLYLNDLGIDHINILEYMYILSDDRPQITLNDKLYYLIEYRRLNDAQKDQVNLCLKAFCCPENTRKYNNKTLMRDYNNWKNESQQIFCLLRNSTYFKVHNGQLILNTGNLGLFDPNAQRRERAKTEYFEKHKIAKCKGYELHHIIPFSKALNKSDAAFLDDYKNMIYLDSHKHSEFTNVGNRHVQLEYNKDDPRILFLAFDNSYIIVEAGKDAKLDMDLLPQMKNYNLQLLRKFYLI